MLDARYPDDCARPDERERERLDDEAERDSLFKSIAADFAAEGPGSLDDEDDAPESEDPPQPQPAPEAADSSATEDSPEGKKALPG